MYRFLEGILVPKTSKVSPQTPKVFERGSEYPQIDFKWLQKCSKITPKGFKVGPNGPKMQQTTLKSPQKALHLCFWQFGLHFNPFWPILTLFGREFKASVALEGPKKALRAFFGPSKATQSVKEWP